MEERDWRTDKSLIAGVEVLGEPIPINMPISPKIRQGVI